MGLILLAWLSPIRAQEHPQPSSLQSCRIKPLATPVSPHWLTSTGTPVSANAWIRAYVLLSIRGMFGKTIQFVDVSVNLLINVPQDTISINWNADVSAILLPACPATSKAKTPVNASRSVLRWLSAPRMQPGVKHSASAFAIASRNAKFHFTGIVKAVIAKMQWNRHENHDCLTTYYHKTYFIQTKINHKKIVF